MNAADVCTHCGGSEGLIQFVAVCDPGCEPINAWLHPSCEQAWLASLPSPSEPAPLPRVHMKTTSNDDRRDPASRNAQRSDHGRCCANVGARTAGHPGTNRAGRPPATKGEPIIMMTTQQQTEQSDHDGLCPVCHKTDGYFDIVRAHWFFCREHRMAWWVGTNLYGILPEDLEEQRRYAEEFVGYQCVEPFYFPETLARAGVTVSTATKGEPTMITAEAICKAYEALLDRRATWFLCDELLKMR